MEKIIAAELPLQRIIELIFESSTDTDFKKSTEELVKLRLVNRCFRKIVSKILNKKFRNIKIENAQTFNDKKWILPELMEKYNINRHVVSINGYHSNFGDVPKCLRFLVSNQSVPINSLECFPITTDTFGVPPQELKTLTDKMDEIIERSNSFASSPIRKYKCLSQMPTSSHVDTLVLTSTFLEYSANELDYSKEGKVLNELENAFGSLTCDELVMVLTDMVTAKDPRMLAKMKIPTFYPLELLRIMLLKLKPKFLNLKLRTESVSSVEDAYRMDWDDFDVFTNFVLFNSPEFADFENTSLGDEPILQDMILVLDTFCALTWSQTMNLAGYNNIGRDYLSLFPMKRIVVDRTLNFDTELTTSSQIMFEIDDLMKLFWTNPTLSSGREFYCTIFLKRKTSSNSDLVISKKLVKKSVPRSFNDCQLRVQYDYEKAKPIFEKFSKPTEKFHEIFAVFNDDSVMYINLVEV